MNTNRKMKKQMTKKIITKKKITRQHIINYFDDESKQ